MLRALEKGQGRAEDIETLLGLVNFLGPGKTFCAHAPGAVEPLGSAIKYFRPSSKPVSRQRWHPAPAGEADRGRRITR
jgi:NADH:ubiquinone oxidoreductase subunit F (NADH-binding)